MKAYCHTLGYILVFTSSPPHPNDNFISQFKSFTVSENAIVNFVYQVKQKTLIIWGEDDQIISNKLAMVSKFYGYEASNATDK